MTTFIWAAPLLAAAMLWVDVLERLSGPATSEQADAWLRARRSVKYG